MEDAQTEAEINMVMTARRETEKKQKADTQDSQLKRAVLQEAKKRVHCICDAAYQRFLARHVESLEDGLRQHDQRGLFQHHISDRRGHAKG